MSFPMKQSHFSMKLLTTCETIVYKEVTKMELDRWIGSYKVRAFPWIDGKRIYFNVQYYAPGQSIEKPPVWDRTVYVTDNEEGRRLVYELTDSLVNHIACMEVKQNG